MSEGAFAIIVKFTLKPGMADAFRPLILENAAASVRDEPTCRQFQVLNDEQNSEIIFLYEVYEMYDLKVEPVKRNKFLRLKLHTFVYFYYCG